MRRLPPRREGFLPLSPGVVIDGRYRVERPLARGQSGDVWEGIQLAVGTSVAIKRMHEHVRDHELVERFAREAKYLARVRSDNVARVIDYIEECDHGSLLVLSLIDGEPLSTRLENGRLTIEEAIDLGVDLAGGVADLHRANVLHRNLEPSNVVEERRSDGSTRAMIVDFGSCRLIAPEASLDGRRLHPITRGAMRIPNPAHTAPEQLNSTEVGPAADLYAIGSILFQAVTGRPPFVSESAIDVIRDKCTFPAPPLDTRRPDPRAQGLAALVARLLERDAALRPATADALKHQLEQLQDLSDSEEGHPPPRTTHPPLVSPLRSRAAIAAAVVLALIAGAAIGRIAQSNDTPRSGRPSHATASARASAATAPSPLETSAEEPEDLYAGGMAQRPLGWLPDPAPVSSAISRASFGAPPAESVSGDPAEDAPAATARATGRAVAPKPPAAAASAATGAAPPAPLPEPAGDPYGEP